MKLLFITEFFPSSKNLRFTGGVEARTFYVAKHLAQKDQVTVICRKTKTLNKPTEFQNIKILPTGIACFFVEANFFSIFERTIFVFSAIIKGLKQQFDLVEGSNFVAFLPAFCLGFLKNKPTLAWYPDVFKNRWLKLFGPTGIVGEIIERVSLKLPWTKIIALSKETKKKLITQGIKEKKIKVIYGGVDIASYSLDCGNINKFLNKKKKNIICISRLVKYKRVEDLIQAFSMLLKKFSHLSCTIIGKGPEEKNLIKLISQKKLEKKITFQKNLSREKLIKLLKNSYIFCLPSLVEGFGLVTIEAAACGLPFVIADTKINQEITLNGQGGLFFKSKNPTDLFKKIERLLKDKKLYQKKKKQALILAKRYNWQKIVKQTRKIYLSLL